MKTGPGTLGTAANGSGNIKHENWTRRPRYRPKRVQEHNTWKLDLEPPIQPKASPGTQNMKTRPGALSTSENGFGSAKHENRTGCSSYRRKRVWKSKTWKLDQAPSVSQKARPGAQNIKTSPDALSTAENEFGSAKQENWTQRPRYHWKRVESGKHENWTGCPRYRRKCVRKRKS
jgi:hypothetical protein